MLRNKIVVISAVMVFIFSYSAYAEELKNVIIIGWDGTQRDHLQELIDAKQLPHLSQLKDEGSYVKMNVTTGRTETKPGWTEILTGYSAPSLGIVNNLKYRPIPKGYTIFERFKDHFGPQNIKTIFIAGKENNLGCRGPHEICDNCKTRLDSHEKSYYWNKDKIKTDKTKDGKPPHWVKREGEPYFYTKDSLDLHKIGLGPAENVGNEVLKALDLYSKDRFIAFFHFEDPDEMGHQFGENSEQYSQGLITNDKWLGVIVDKLKQLGIYDKTLLILTSDHGFNKGSNDHKYAPETFLATNSKSPFSASGDRKDVSPTIYDEFGLDISRFQPPLDGKSLLIKKPAPLTKGSN